MNKKEGMRFSLLVGAITFLEVEIEVKGLFIFLVSLDKICNVSIKKNTKIVWCNRGAVALKMLILCSIALFNIASTVIMMFILSFYILYKYIYLFSFNINNYRLKRSIETHNHKI